MEKMVVVVAAALRLRARMMVPSEKESMKTATLLLEPPATAVTRRPQ